MGDRQVALRRGRRVGWWVEGRPATAVFHRYYQTADLRPNYVHHPPA